MKKVSILIPIYGVEKYIEKCILSLFQQTYRNVEYIFVNDSTKDSSMEILKTLISHYPERSKQVRILEHEHNCGLAAARNTAVDACTGDYLWHVDSDDWIELDAVEKLVNAAEKNKADIVVFGHYNVRVSGITEVKIDYKDKVSYISNILLHSTPGSVWNKFFNTDFYRNSGIRSIEGLNHGEDYVIIPRLLHKANKIDILEKPLYYYNLTNQNSYTRNISLKSIGNIHQAYKINLDYFMSVADKESYTQVLKQLPFRSMLALIKKANKENFKDIICLYPECFEQIYSGSSEIDRFILFLLKMRMFSLLSLIIRFYKYIN